MVQPYPRSPIPVEEIDKVPSCTMAIGIMISTNAHREHDHNKDGGKDFQSGQQKIQPITADTVEIDYTFFPCDCIIIVHASFNLA